MKGGCLHAPYGELDGNECIDRHPTDSTGSEYGHLPCARAHLEGERERERETFVALTLTETLALFLTETLALIGVTPRSK